MHGSSEIGLIDQLSCRAYVIRSSFPMSSPPQSQKDDNDLASDREIKRFDDRSSLRVTAWKIDLVVIPLVGMFCALVHRAH